MDENEQICVFNDAAERKTAGVLHANGKTAKNRGIIHKTVKNRLIICIEIIREI